MDAFEIIKRPWVSLQMYRMIQYRLSYLLQSHLSAKKRFRKLYPQALAYLAAHKMKMSGLGKTIGIGTVGGHHWIIFCFRR